MPEVQLALVGSMATDDPEGWDFFQRTFRHADGDPDIKILNNLNNVGAIEVNAFQSQADVCMQKSIARGLRLTVTEALWKGRPTIGGDVGGIPLQIMDGESRASWSLAEEAAQRTIEILRDPELAKRLGRRARSTPASTSSAPACCATGSSCSPSSRASRPVDFALSGWLTTSSARDRLEPGPGAVRARADGERVVQRAAAAW